MVFSLSALWWIRIRCLWKFPNRRDWLWGNLGLVLMGRVMLSKSLVQIYVDGWTVFPPCGLAWGQPRVEVMALMATSFKRAYSSKPIGSQDLYSLHGRVEGHGLILSQRITRRDKKAFLSYQCKEIEQNNRMGKTRDLFKKIRDTKGTFHAKMGLIK